MTRNTSEISGLQKTIQDKKYYLEVSKNSCCFSDLVIMDN